MSFAVRNAVIDENSPAVWRIDADPRDKDGRAVRALAGQSQDWIRAPLRFLALDLLPAQRREHRLEILFDVEAVGSRFLTDVIAEVDVEERVVCVAELL